MQSILLTSFNLLLFWYLLQGSWDHTRTGVGHFLGHHRGRQFFTSAAISCSELQNVNFVVNKEQMITPNFTPAKNAKMVSFTFFFYTDISTRYLTFYNLLIWLTHAYALRTTHYVLHSALTFCFAFDSLPSISTNKSVSKCTRSNATSAKQSFLLLLSNTMCELSSDIAIAWWLKSCKGCDDMFLRIRDF